MAGKSVPNLQNPDAGVAYQTLYDALADAYWDATDIGSKDLLTGAQQAIGQIIHAIDEQQLTENTALFVQLAPKIKAVNDALKTIQMEIAQITKNINTAAEVLGAIGKVLSLFPALA